MLSIKNLTIQANEKEILTNVSVDFDINKVYAIMGVNGSGKSSLVKSIMGDPDFIVTNGSITINTTEISKLKPNERARYGIFLSPQSPIAIPGVTVSQLLRAAIPRDKMSSKDLIKKIDIASEELRIPKSLLKRSLNENFSGGERKKMEVLQVAVLNPTYIILDEIDTGVDIDALKVIARFLKKLSQKDGVTLILITHYNRILSYLPVDKVIVMKDGKVTQTGDAPLADKIEKEGYQK
ncbi:MAG TPA: Fe-S cluster assembly ATPase SufC [Candidatus Pacebacteria bacterium]|nr:Fe-S cluster assembly ATPase SufC [Candidatus Paceibacterota bacterium]